MKSVVMLSGPVGAGKTTVAQELVACSPAPVACIEGDMFWSFIAKGGPDEGRLKNFKMIMRSMLSASMPYALAGYEVIVDFSIPPWFLNTALAVAKFRDVPLDYVVLRPSETICAARAAARPQGTITDYAYYHDLYTSFDEADKYIVQDDTGDASAVAARVRSGLDGGKFRIST